MKLSSHGRKRARASSPPSSQSWAVPAASASASQSLAAAAAEEDDEWDLLARRALGQLLAVRCSPAADAEAADADAALDLALASARPWARALQRVAGGGGLLARAERGWDSARVDALADALDDCDAPVLGALLRPARAPAGCFLSGAVALLASPRLQAALLPRLVPRVADDGSVAAGVLRCLAALEHVWDVPALSKLVTDVLPLADADAQREVLAVLPELADLSCATQVVAAVQSFADSEPARLGDVFGCLERLPKPPALEPALRKWSLQYLGSGGEAHLGAVVGFLLGTGSTDDRAAVLADVIADWNILCPGAGRPAAVAPEECCAQFRVVEAVARHLEWDPAMARRSWRVLAARSSAGAAPAGLDLWVLVLYFGFPDHRRAVERSLAKMLSAGRLTAAAIRAGYSGRHELVQLQFDALLGLSGWMLAQDAGHEVGCALYSVLLQDAAVNSLVDGAERYAAVVAELAAHASPFGAARPAERVAALTVLEDAGRLQPVHMRHCAEYVRALLDGVHLAEPVEVWLLYSTLAGFACGDQQRSEDAAAHARYLHVLLSKQLLQTKPRYIMCGALGTLAAALRLCSAGAATALHREEIEQSVDTLLFRTVSTPGGWRAVLEALNFVFPLHGESMPTELVQQILHCLDGELNHCFRSAGAVREFLLRSDLPYECEVWFSENPADVALFASLVHETGVGRPSRALYVLGPLVQAAVSLERGRGGVGRRMYANSGSLLASYATFRNAAGQSPEVCVELLASAVAALSFEGAAIRLRVEDPLRRGADSVTAWLRKRAVLEMALDDGLAASSMDVQLAVQERIGLSRSAEEHADALRAARASGWALLHVGALGSSVSALGPAVAEVALERLCDDVVASGSDEPQPGPWRIRLVIVARVLAETRWTLEEWHRMRSDLTSEAAELVARRLLPRLLGVMDSLCGRGTPLVADASPGDQGAEERESGVALQCTLFALLLELLHERHCQDDRYHRAVLAGVGGAAVCLAPAATEAERRRLGAMTLRSLFMRIEEYCGFVSSIAAASACVRGMLRAGELLRGMDSELATAVVGRAGRHCVQFAAHDWFERSLREYRSELHARELRGFLQAAVRSSTAPLRLLAVLLFDHLSTLLPGSIAEELERPEHLEGNGSDEAWLDEVGTLRSLGTETYPLYYGTLFDELASLPRERVLQLQDGAEADPLELDANLDRVQVHVLLFLAFLTMTKAADDSDTAILAAAMRSGRRYLDGFVRELLPFLQAHFKHRPRAVLRLFKYLQSGTRLLQALCTDHKTSGMTASTLSIIPGLRRSLESLIFKVKMMLQVNGCLESFQVGVLKNKDRFGNAANAE